MLQDLRPPPVLSIGLTGHRKMTANRSEIAAVERSLRDLLTRLKLALPAAAAADSDYFAATGPRVRLMTMGAEGADLLGMRAANSCGFDLDCVLPFPWEEYREDFSPEAATEAAECMAKASSRLVLPGRHAEGPRAYERANDVILANVDLLVAIWDGERARGRAGTGDVVQAAIVREIPVVVLDPRATAAPGELVVPPFDFEPPVASDLTRRPLDPDLTGFVLGLISPPRGTIRRQALADLLNEVAAPSNWRFEYPTLVKAMVGRSADQLRRPDGKPAGDRSGLATATLFEEASREFDPLDAARKTIDGLAVHYGRLFRSSTTGQYLYVILGIWVAGVFGLLFPKWSAFSIAAQLAANVAVIVDAHVRTKWRWQERWLDYRVVAERLRWIRFRRSFGLGVGRQRSAAVGKDATWTEWYIRRWARALAPPSGNLDAVSLGAASRFLTDIEIPEQIAYHRRTFRQLGRLERRLANVANAALLIAAGVAVLLGIAAVNADSLDAVGWKPLAVVLLTALPAAMTGFNGLRVDADLVRLVERSMLTLTMLSRIRRSILGAPPSYDHIAPNVERLASIMGNELAEWRFVIESRRTRNARHKLSSKRRWWRTPSR
jgi:hypothetical protein